jgi:hypothetical protein
MYAQIKFTCGNEVYSPKRGKSEVRGSNGEVKFTGTYRQCCQWLLSRGCRMIG